ncbi:hypothetical protein [Nocardia carnea]|uniref:hypothetical protein n=1 Tax=Nocardia carnea TaxID=37328 RepID=UPI00245647AE|nr:hypothetical protein [Nocardia carnea]
MSPVNRRRALVIGTHNTSVPDLDRLIDRHSLEVVFTVFGPSAPKLATLVTIQHILEYDADVVIVPHLTTAEIQGDGHWQAVAGLADILTADGAWLR